MIVPQPQSGIIIIGYYSSCLFDYLILVYLQQKYVKLKSNCVNNIVCGVPVTTIQIRWPDIFRFHIAPGTENQIAVTPTLMSTSSNAMSRSTLQRIFAEMEKYLSFPSSLTTGMILARFNSEQRDCYNEDEIALKFLPRDHGYRCCVVPLCHCAIVPLCHYAIMSLCHCAIVPDIIGRYEMSNCLFEAAFENILEQCKWVQI